MMAKQKDGGRKIFLSGFLDSLLLQLKACTSQESDRRAHAGHSRTVTMATGQRGPNMYETRRRRHMIVALRSTQAREWENVTPKDSTLTPGGRPGE